mmetsp:Transcript_58644/g.94760  ORF Transcript_58644/g.94760 Transcript_58644/m.94760 type:complete len:254 (-) Transcript_58644:1101-1862(-)
MQDERPRVANIRQVGEQMTSFYNFDPIVVPSLQPKRENRAPVTFEVLLRERFVLITVQPCVRHPGNFGMRFQKLRHLQAICAMALHAQWQGLNACNREKRIERRHRRPKIAKTDRMAIERKRQVAKGLSKSQSVVRRFGLRQTRKFVRVFHPIEFAGINDSSTHRIAVPRQKLGGGVNYDISSVLEGSTQVGRGHGVVDDKRNASLLCDIRERADVRDDAAGIREALRPQQLHLWVAAGGTHSVKVIYVDKYC